MTKLEKAIWAVSDLRDFYRRIHELPDVRHNAVRKRKKSQESRKSLLPSVIDNDANKA
ncbi:MAG: hypothetical protein NTX50_04045 [Candidatus Sumerlaeota bacterium]|nr:hypothetical protein [Candidatus Sumerlaeota bacterium]